MRGKVICRNNLLDRFQYRLSRAESVDIATSWVTPGKHLRVLAAAAADRDVKIRAIVGISGNATHPNALMELSKITAGDLRIVPKSDRLFHPKLYLFKRRRDGIARCHAWIGSANLTRAGFGGSPNANEEIILEVDPGEQADALAHWFQECWNHYRMDSPVSEKIRRYKEDWSPPHRQVQLIAGRQIRRDLLGDHGSQPLTLEEYRQVLSKCEELLRDEGRKSKILDPQGESYMRVIADRRKLLLGDVSWSKLDDDSRRRLKGSYRHENRKWWGMTGRMGRKNWPAVCKHEMKIRDHLDTVRQAKEHEFPDVAVDAMRVLMDINNVGYGTATLLLTLARPDRLLSLNKRSATGYGKLSGMNHRTLGKPENYRKLLQWLYDLPWYKEYKDAPPRDEDLVPIWNFRAALVDPFVYEPT